MPNLKSTGTANQYWLTQLKDNFSLLQFRSYLHSFVHHFSYNNKNQSKSWDLRTGQRRNNKLVNGGNKWPDVLSEQCFTLGVYIHRHVRAGLSCVRSTCAVHAVQNFGLHVDCGQIPIFTSGKFLWPCRCKDYHLSLISNCNGVCTRAGLTH